MICHPDILIEYCTIYADVAVVVLCPDGLITSCNSMFTRQIRGNGRGEAACLHKPLLEWLTFTDRSDWLVFTSPDALQTRRFSVQIRSGTDRLPYTGIAIRHQDQQALFIQRDLQQDVDVLARITQLNMEMSAMARDLSRKNRQLRSANEKISRLIDTDPLTGVYNRRYLLIQLDAVASYARRTPGFSFSILMIDIDFFKEVNDTHGHAAGDAVLLALTRFVSKNIRREDILVRFGGEEFIILLPGQDDTRALVAAEKIRGLVAQSPMPHDRLITISCGVATWSGQDDTVEALLKRVDDALYTAKAAGRNQVAFQ